MVQNFKHQDVSIIQLHMLAFCFLLSMIFSSCGESSTCLTVYKQGGAPAVFQSPKCPSWKLPTYSSQIRTSKCQSAILQGRRRSQEDRTLCALDVLIPFPGTTGLAEVMVGIAAIFDGHNGAEASDMASKLLLEYLVLHTYFLLDAALSSVLKKSTGRLPSHVDEKFSFQLLKDEGWVRRLFDHGRFKLIWPEVFDGSFHLEILKESLLRTIGDIDATFSKEAYKYNLDSGTTATVILIVDGQILVANLGDSKALLCSEKYQSPMEAKATFLRLYRQKRSDGAVLRLKDCDNQKMMISNGLAHLYVKELTRDHHPDRDDEKLRVEMAGGYVFEWGGVPRVNGQLAVSRAIGDVSFKRYGVTSDPEVTDWQPLTVNDSYLIAASDGVFEKLDTQDICDLLWEVQNEDPIRSQISSVCSYSLADCIVHTAFEKGSTDNLAAVVVPLRTTGVSNSLLNGRCSGGGDIDCLSSGLQKIMGQSADEVSSTTAQLQHAHPIVAKFDRLLVEEKHGRFGCFYLAENLKESENHMFLGVEDEKHANKLPHALPGSLDLSCGGSLNLYSEKDMCFNFGMAFDGHKDQCIYQEGFASFLGLLESIPLHNTGPNFESFEHGKPEMRYKLRRRFDRGAYGEVWLAFHWNCSQYNDSSNWSQKNTSSSTCCSNINSYDENSGMTSPRHDSDGGSPEDNSFILKRIMVERGTAVYLSGLREKYFGEIFLNASTSLDGFLASTMATSLIHESSSNLYDLLEMDESAAEAAQNIGNFEHTFLHRNRTSEVVYEEGLNHIARYVESFESQSKEIWLVFKHEGRSLSKLMYTAEKVETHADEGQTERVVHAHLLRPSEWWHWLKTTNAGQEEMRSLLWQLLMALKSCHDRNITHRDIKPENMLVCIEDQETGTCLNENPVGDAKHVKKMRIIDFGSAVDDFTIRNLYGSMGPSRAEQTYEYTPPEALLNSSWYRGPTSRTLKYDLWSVGVVILELVLGSPDVFQISSISQALLDKHIEGWNEDLKELAYRLRSFMEMCILIPGHPSRLHRYRAANNQARVSPASWKCSEEFFSNLIKSRDPLKIGFPNVWAMRLVRQLLLWDPDDRLSVDDALQHPYFQLPLQSS
ncbi:hypothetical protein Nepgr_022706 [Nepenthes gracilis]|uniref:Protein-serine/threonine phosphatase n=1 Tax=Nepenthes gracilis TaxID=150966 RepID=A0AAD3XYC4_NEPGR|nr:hypothetical protein Nepgr_022706 [Nepenthes gracilis]